MSIWLIDIFIGYVLRVVIVFYLEGIVVNKISKIFVIMDFKF